MKGWDNLRTASDEMDLSAALDVMMDGFVVLHSETTGFHLANQKYLEMSGFSHQELLELCFYDLEVNSNPIEGSAFRRLSVDSNTHRFETRQRCKDGSVITIEVTAKQSAGQIVASIRNLSKARRNRKNLEIQTQLLKQAERIACLGHWQYELQTNQLTWSEGVFNIFGFDKNVAPSFAHFLARIHPEDRELVEVTYQSHLKYKTPFDLIHRIEMYDGSIKFLHERCQSEYDKDDVPVRTLGIVQDISERVEAEASLKRSKQSFKSVLMGIPDLIFVFDKDGIYREVYADREKLYAPEAQLLGQHVSAHLPADIVSKFLVKLAEVLRTGNPEIMTYSLDYPDGAESFEARIFRYTAESAVVVVRDQSEMETANQKIAASEERLKLILDTVVDGIISINQKGRIVSFNRAAERLFGYRQHEILGKNVRMLMPDELASQHNRFLQKYLSSRRAKVAGVGRKVTCKRRDGTLFPALIGVGEHVRGKTHFFTGVVKDLTKETQLEQQLAHSQKMEAVGQLVGGIAHDFNNILSIVTGNLDIIEAKLDNAPRLQRNISRAIRATERAETLTRKLLQFSRKQPLDIKPYSLNLLIKEMCELLETSITKNIQLELRLARDLQLTSLNRGDFEDALLNLAINARDAMHRHGTLTLTTRNAHISPDKAKQGNFDFVPGDYIYLGVADTGAGIDEFDIDRVFDPFFTTKETGKGTGLGLSMVYGFVKRCGGYIDLDSTPLQGTTFHIWLPMVADADNKNTQDDVQNMPAFKGSYQLVVLDDEADLLDVLQDYLSDQPFKAYYFTDPEAAMAFIADTPHIDLVISDVVMPGGIKGPDVIDTAKTKHPDLVGFLMTGYAGNVELVPGDYNVLSKPFNRQMFLQRIKSVLEPESTNAKAG